MGRWGTHKMEFRTPRTRLAIAHLQLCTQMDQRSSSCRPEILKAGLFSNVSKFSLQRCNKEILNIY